MAKRSRWRKPTTPATSSAAAAGNDKIEGGVGDDILVGGPGNDRIFSRRGNDLLVGDSYSRAGDAIGKTARDTLYGGRGNEVIVGDNLAAGNATGAKPDRLGGNVGGETIIGDSAVTGSGTASGGADDWIAGDAGRRPRDRRFVLATRTSRTEAATTS